MALVNHCHKIVGEIIEQAERTRSREPSVEIPAVILDTGAVAHFLHHFHIIRHALIEAFCFEFLALALEILDFGAEVELNLSDSRRLALGRGHENVGRKDIE